eukprot:Nitzschia sp. Nitz4//scaffold167_size49223//35599//36857//NITZ4_007040-RA/size49223-processed-gene-0.62-mRNA-1//-1//CDS//3329538290//6109//frame0
MSTVDNDPSKNKYRLHMFPPCPGCYNISPFAIKVESFFRINRIPYENVYTSKFGAKGKIPYVTTAHLPTEQLCDSNVIVNTIMKDTSATLIGRPTTDAILTPHQKAVAHTTIRMLEEHTAQIGFHYRYGRHMEEFTTQLDLPRHLFSADTSRKGRIVAWIWKSVQPKGTLKVSRYRGLTRHTDEELWEFCNHDLQALSDLLADQPYFFGETPTALDCTVYGHLSQFLWVPLEYPQKEYLLQRCPNLVNFMYRFRDAYWPDWKEKCQRQPNAKYNQKNGQSLQAASRANDAAIVSGGFKYRDPARHLSLRERPYQHDSTASRPLSEVKHVRAQLVLRWGTTLES